MSNASSHSDYWSAGWNRSDPVDRQTVGMVASPVAQVCGEEGGGRWRHLTPAARCWFINEEEKGSSVLLCDLIWSQEKEKARGWWRGKLWALAQLFNSTEEESCCDLSLYDKSSCRNSSKITFGPLILLLGVCYRAIRCKFDYQFNFQKDVFSPLYC